MQTLMREITKEQYEHYKQLKAERRLSSEVAKTLSDDIKLGYGYYGAYLSTQGGKFYLNIEIGSSCD